MVQVAQELESMIVMLEDAKVDAERFDRGIMEPGKRVRKTMQGIRDKAFGTRKLISDIKKENQK